MLSKKFLSLQMAIILIFLSCTFSTHAEAKISFVILSKYSATVNIGTDFRIIAVTSSAKLPSFSSSSSRIASVNTYGLVSPKRPGTAKITVKIAGAEASCQVNVLKTNLTLNSTKISMERNFSFQLSANVTNNREVTYKSNRKSVVIVDECGLITALKPGSAIITAKADTTEVLCYVTVRKPRIKLNVNDLSLYRGQSSQLLAGTSSGLPVKFSSSKTSVATIDETGKINAIKHGDTVIYAKLDGSQAACHLKVKSPSITLSTTALTLKVRKSKKVTATVSSGNIPTWSCSNSRVASVSQKGIIYAIKKGTAFIYVSEDGTKVKLKLTVK